VESGGTGFVFLSNNLRVNVNLIPMNARRCLRNVLKCEIRSNYHAGMVRYRSKVVVRGGFPGGAAGAMDLFGSF